MATIPGRWACRPDLEDYFVAVVLALAFILLGGGTPAASGEEVSDG